jgi:hypothetical protein
MRCVDTTKTCITQGVTKKPSGITREALPGWETDRKRHTHPTKHIKEHTRTSGGIKNHTNLKKKTKETLLKNSAPRTHFHEATAAVGKRLGWEVAAAGKRCSYRLGVAGFSSVGKKRIERRDRKDWDLRERERMRRLRRDEVCT